MWQTIISGIIFLVLIVWILMLWDSRQFYIDENESLRNQLRTRDEKIKFYLNEKGLDYYFESDGVPVPEENIIEPKEVKP
jgi:flagellar biosynthesis/type III secretory pathway M-ring protein FliF/YscJ